MSAMRCRYENEMIRALRSGALSEALIEHRKGCADCRAAVMVAQMLRMDAGDLAAQYAPPPPAVIWSAAEQHRRRMALACATRFLRVMKAAGVVYAAVLVAWALYSLAGHGGISVPGLDAKSLNAAIGGAGLAALFVGSGLWYTLRGDKRPTERSTG